MSRHQHVIRLLYAAAAVLVGACPRCGAEPGTNIDCVTCKILHVTTAKVAPKKLSAFDCDETLLTSEGSITVEKANGERVAMTSATFAHYKAEPGDKLDFSAFNHIRKPRKIKKNWELFHQAVSSGDRVVILTARSKGAASAIRKFLENEGIDASKVEIVALASSDPYDKAKWVSTAVEDGGHEDVEFYDDSKANADAVAEYGKKHSERGIKFKSVNVPHPKGEDDFAGPPVDKHFDSDEPSDAVVHKPGGEKHKTEKHGEWWDRMSDEFRRNYCRDHKNSKYC